MKLVLLFKKLKYWCTRFCKYKYKRLFVEKNSIIKKRCHRYLCNNDSYTNEMFPEISKKWMRFFQTQFENTTFPSQSENALVIVETRNDKRLSFVLQNISYYVPNWKLHIFHSKENINFIKSILGEKAKNVMFHLLEKPINSPLDYNNLLLSESFWNTLSEHNKVLIFQSDSFMLRSGIENFLRYDYIGAPWRWWESRFNDMQRVGGNGGFSLRNVQKMKEIIQKHKDKAPPNVADYHNEDVFFSYHLYQDKNAILPSFHDALLFASESILCQKSLAVHQTWRFFKGYYPTFKK